MSFWLIYFYARRRCNKHCSDALSLSFALIFVRSKFSLLRDRIRLHQQQAGGVRGGQTCYHSNINNTVAMSRLTPQKNNCLLIWYKKKPIELYGGKYIFLFKSHASVCIASFCGTLLLKWTIKYKWWAEAKQMPWFIFIECL